MIIDRRREATGPLRFLEFFLTRNIGTLVDTAVLWLFADLVFKGSYVGVNIVSPTISFEVATLVNYITSCLWIWGPRVKEHSFRSHVQRFLTFNLSSVLGFLIKMALLLLFERLFGWHVVICNLAALAISGFFNFFFAEMWVFGRCRPRPARELVSREEMAQFTPLFSGVWGQRLAVLVLNALGISKLNRMYDSVADNEGVSFASHLLQRMGCDYLVGNADRLDSLPEGAFITISNHPYGGLDGIVLVDLMGHRRSDFKVMVNEFLLHVKAMASTFITVTPKTAASDESTRNLSGVRGVIHQLQEGHPMGFFPAGAVSNYIPKRHHIEDREWQPSLVRLILRSRVPVIPIRFFDRNSRFFYLLGLINWRIRTLRLPGELLNKHSSNHRLAIGETISVEEQQKFADDPAAFGRFLREKVYGMPLPDNFIHSSELFKNEEDPPLRPPMGEGNPPADEGTPLRSSSHPLRKALGVGLLFLLSSLVLPVSAQKMYVNQFARYKTTQIFDVASIDSFTFGPGTTHLSDTLIMHLTDGTTVSVRAHSSYTDSITFTEPRDLLLREIDYYDKNAYNKDKNPYGRPTYADYYRSISGWGQRSQWNLANVHDPTVMRASDGYYYMYQTDASFGNAHVGHGHFHCRRSQDLLRWEYLGATLMDDCPAWALDSVRAYYSRMGREPVGELTGMGYWAPVARRIADDLYRMYYCLVADQWALIGLMETSDPASNAWEDRGFVICSSSDKAASAFGTGSQWGGWFRFNAIDPTYVVTPEGRHWLIYGSWHSGIVAIELDPVTGKTKNTLGDPWHIGIGTNTTYGQRIATREATSRWQGSEGPEAIFNPQTGYYYLFLAYDELAVAYNTRVARSRSITGPYVGMDGTNITTGGQCFPVVTHPYRFNSSQNPDGWVGISHCAVFDDGQGNWYYASQGRLPEGYNGDAYSNAIMMGHVRRILWTQSGWPVVLPERYGAVPQASITTEELVGTWEHINLNYDYKRQQTSTPLVLNADGTLTGAFTGKWSFDPATSQLRLGSYTVCVARELDWEATPRRSTLVYAGYSPNGSRTFWGKRISH